MWHHVSLLMRNKYFLKNFFAILIPAICLQSVFAQSSSHTLWTKATHDLRSSERTWYPNHYSSFTLQADAMRSYLATAPMEKNVASRKSSFKKQILSKKFFCNFNTGNMPAKCLCSKLFAYTLDKSHP